MMINLTPAFAIQMEQIANEAQNYNNESQQEMGFFKKISFMIDGFKLIDKAEDAQQNSKLPETEENKDIHRQLFEQTVLTELQKSHLLTFRNNENNSLNIHMPVESKTKVNKNLKTAKNKTNETANANQTVHADFVLPDVCFSNIQSVINMLGVQGFSVSQELQKEIGSSLQGSVVQLIDEGGNIRYAYVKSIDLKSGKVILLNDENKEQIIGLDEFKMEFKGLTLKLGSDIKPEELMGNITQMQRNELDTEKTNADNVKVDAENGIILWGILLGVGVLLMVVGIIIAIYFGKALAAEIQNLGNSARGSYTLGFQSENTFEGIMSDANSCITRPYASPDQVLANTYKCLQLSMDQNLAASMITGLTIAGFTVAAFSASEIAMNAIAQNWIKLVLCIVGVIIFIVGLGLTIASVILLVRAVENRNLAEFSLKLVNNRTNELEEWLNKGKPVDNSLNNETMLNKNGTINLSLNNTYKPIPM